MHKITQIKMLLAHKRKFYEKRSYIEFQKVLSVFVSDFATQNQFISYEYLCSKPIVLSIHLNFSGSSYNKAGDL